MTEQNSEQTSEQTQTKDLEALDELIQEATSKEAELQKVAQELSARDQQFADFYRQQQRIQDEMEVLWAEAKEYMQANGITEHENDFIRLTLTPSGKYRATIPIEDVPDELCEIKKTLSNKKVKAYYELSKQLPEGIESTGFVLRKKLKN